MIDRNDRYRWARLRAGLRRFVDRTAWSPAEIARGVGLFYGHPATQDEIFRLLCDIAPDPKSVRGLDAMARFMSENAGCRLPFDQWRARRLARIPASIWAKGDALHAQAAAVEAEREAQRRHWLARERRSWQVPAPAPDPFAGLDAATIAALSGGTIVARGVRL